MELDTTPANAEDRDAQAPLPAPLALGYPWAWPLSGQDQLRLTAVGSVASLSIVASVRTLTQAGQIQRQVLTMAVGSTRTVQTSDFFIGDGFLLDVTVRAAAGSPIVGQCYVVVDLILGAGGEKQKLTTLTQGYVTATGPIFGPGGAAQGALDGGGALRSINGTTPGAGAEVSETVPTGARWELLSFGASLVTSATVANRLPYLSLDDGANVYFRQSQASAHAASTAELYYWAPGIIQTAAANNSIQGAPLPVGNKLGAGHRIRTVTQALQVGDQWSAVQYLVREWLEL